MLNVLIGFLALFIFLFVYREYRDRIRYPNQLQKIKSFLENEEFDRAFSLVNSLYKKNKHDPRLKWYKSKCEIHQGQYILAIVSLNEMIHDDEFTPEIKESMVHASLAKVYELSGRINEAMTEYLILLEKDPNSYEANIKIGRHFFNHKNYEKSEKYLKAANVLNDKIEEPLLLLGKLYLKKGRYLNAETFFKRVLVINPQHEESLFMLGSIFMDKKDFINAADLFSQCSSIREKFFIKSNLNWAVCLKEQNNFNGAQVLVEENIDRIDKSDPIWKECYVLLIDIYDQSHKYKELKNAFEEYFKVYPDDIVLKRREALFKNLFDFPILSRFHAKEKKMAIIEIKKLCENLGYIVDNIKELNDGTILMRISKIFKAMQKSSELLFIFRKSDDVFVTAAQKAMEIIKSSGARAGYLFAPFSFSKDTVQYAKSVPLSLFDGHRMVDFLNGENVF